MKNSDELRPTKKYYVYVLSMSADGDQAFYVGKGTKKRYANHGSEAKLGECSPKCAVIRYLFRNLGWYYHGFAFETDDENEALWYEMKTITSYPYGTLCNAAGRPHYPVKVEPLHFNGVCWRGQVEYTPIKGGFADELFIANEASRERAARLMSNEYDRGMLPYFWKYSKYSKVRKTVDKSVDRSQG